MNEFIHGVTAEIKNRLASLYGDRLKDVYLFGSFAREEADDESDIDILIILEEVENHMWEVARTSEIMSQLSLACGRSITCVFASKEQWKNEETMFFLNVREEAIPA